MSASQWIEKKRHDKPQFLLSLSFFPERHDEGEFSATYSRVWFCQFCTKHLMSAIVFLCYLRAGGHVGDQLAPLFSFDGKIWRSLLCSLYGLVALVFLEPIPGGGQFAAAARSSKTLLEVYVGWQGAYACFCQDLVCTVCGLLYGNAY